MKKFNASLLFAAALSFSNFQNVQAQQKEPFVQKFYGDLAIGSGNYNSTNTRMSLNMTFRNNWSVTVGQYRHRMDVKNLPANFDPGHFSLFGIPIVGNTPRQEINSTAVTVGRTFELSRSIWWTPEVGMSFNKGSNFSFHSRSSEYNDWLLFGERTSNYKVTQEAARSTGLMLKTDLTWAFSNFMGVNIGGYYNGNSIQSPMGIEIGWRIGWMNRKAKN